MPVGRKFRKKTTHWIGFDNSLERGSNPSDLADKISYTLRGD